MIFAQGAEAVQWGAMITMGITTLGAVAASAFAWLKDRDKLRHDAELVQLRVECDRCQKDIDFLRKEVEECHKEKDDVKEKSERETRELRQEIRELRERQDAHWPRRRRANGEGEDGK